MAQSSYTKADSVIYEKYVTGFSKFQKKPLNELFVLTGKHFLGTPYVASTLEGDGEEKLVVNLKEFDCTTFVESCLALAKEIKKGDKKSFEGFMQTLQNMRYRDGKIDGYTSRIHYTSDWVYENIEFFENITVKLGGQIVEKPLSFMSSNSHLYPSLQSSIKNREVIKFTEQRINDRKNYAVLPVNKIKQAEKNIKNGDIIIFATKINGLDYSHIGIAYWEKNVLRLLHASSVRKKVIIDTKNLLTYCTTSKNCTGITVLRLNEDN